MMESFCSSTHGSSATGLISMRLNPDSLCASESKMKVKLTNTYNLSSPGRRSRRITMVWSAPFNVIASNKEVGESATGDVLSKVVLLDKLESWLACALIVAFTELVGVSLEIISSSILLSSICLIMFTIPSL